MTDEASLSRSFAARISAQANNHALGVKARSADRSQYPRSIEARLQGYLS